MRSIQHTGTPVAERHTVVPCQIEHHADTLATNVSLLDAFDQLCQQRGVQSAVATLRGGVLTPLAYVMPALSKMPEYAVFYSDRYEVHEPVQIESATITKGLRDGQPWLHCHAIWSDAQGKRMAGHILPNEATLTQAPDLNIWYVHGADFDVLPCTESRFSLFTPVPATATTSSEHSQQAFAVTIRPNQDVCEEIATICRNRGIRYAVIRGGVGSLVGAEFTDGTRVEPFVTEVFIEQGTIDTTLPGGEGVRIDAGIVDYQHGIHRGRLQAGSNPVLVTFEMVIEPVDARP